MPAEELYFGELENTDIDVILARAESVASLQHVIKTGRECVGMVQQSVLSLEEQHKEGVPFTDAEKKELFMTLKLARNIDKSTADIYMGSISTNEDNLRVQILRQEIRKLVERLVRLRDEI